MYEEMLAMINAERARFNVKPLAYRPELTAAANLRAKEAKALWSHTRPDGTPYWHVDGRIWGENLARFYGSAQDIVNAWMNSPLHKKNLLEPNYKGACIGTFENYVSLEFTKD